MRRRTFLELAALSALHQAAPSARAAAVSRTAAPSYGSGHFGQWETDRFGLPAYRYTCDQTRDPKAVEAVNEAWRSRTDHIHQFGNDRVVAVASNYGYVQLRQDEGSPKFLNDYFPAKQRFGGGIGYLVDGELCAGTHYPSPKAASFQRTFGTGYLRKQLQAGGFAIDQHIFAPFGDDPVLISQVTITNRTAQRLRPRWIEYWGCRPYQFSYRSLMEGSVMTNADAVPQLRRDLSQRFEPRFEQLPNTTGLLVEHHFLGRSREEEDLWLKLQESLRKNPHGYFGGPVAPLAAGASMDDLAPPATFLLSLDGVASGFSTDANAFFRNGPEDPVGAHSPLSSTIDSTGEPAFLLERALDLAPHESQTLTFLYGYLPEGFTLDSLITKYSAQPASHLAASSEKWKANTPVFRVEGYPWIEREIAWNAGYLRSALTYDSFFREHILSQGAGYQYLAGLQGAARDPLQHALPLVFTEPDIVRGILRYTLKEIQPEGSLPYGIVGSSVPMPCRYLPSDSELWVLWLASEYVLATRDVAFLDEKVSTYPSGSAPQPARTIRELLAHCFQHITERIGTGEHGLQRILNGDWNDSIVVNRLTPEQVAEITAHGESVLNAAMASWVFDQYARLLEYTHQPQAANAAHAKAEAQRQAVRRQWTGRWFRRAWLGKDSGWNGEKQLWLEPQPWALLGGCATPEQSVELIHAIDEMSRKPSPIGALLQSPVDPTMKDAAGSGTNGGIFAAINATLIWALAQHDGAMAWDEWKKNTFAVHAERYPEMWFGIWSGPDAYDSIFAKRPGATGPDFPVLNMHSHAWPLYTATKLLGVDFHQQGVHLRPVLPEASYEFATPLFGLRKVAPGRYSGWYEPSQPGRWTITVELPDAEHTRSRSLLVNGAAVPLAADRSLITFAGDSRPGHPLRWELR
ncbi:GH36-type glycosyl hydrolase domain-containing protein [Terriglobus roseus]|uniref:Glycosyl hydrolase 36 superfamily n=1 Tax=Terriglobus roseus TaxID=392734 RepID=A0A1H4JW73_9BACT|nr:hypothetical protein [Terriglobus roseus]SEB50088.1 glycosyl hydrolase 36 superfamily [Terriglobus roseus]